MEDALQHPRMALVGVFPAAGFVTAEHLQVAVRQSINVLPYVTQVLTPSLRYVPGPKGARLIFIRPDDNQMDRPRRKVQWRFSVDPVVAIDFANYAIARIP